VPTLAAIQHAESGHTREETYRHWLHVYRAHHGHLPSEPRASFRSLVSYHLRHIYPPRRRGRKIEPPQKLLSELFARCPHIRFSDARVLWMYWYKAYYGYLPDEPDAHFDAIWSQYAPDSRKQQQLTQRRKDAKK
jgi:hypothetical protein